MQLFFSRAVMGRYGRDPEFLKHVQLNVPDYIAQKAATHLQSATCTQNYFLHRIFTGSFGHRLPVYLRAENFAVIKKNIYCLQAELAAADEVMVNQSFNAYCLSNIFEYLSLRQFQDWVHKVNEALPASACLAYWNLMADRKFSDVLAKQYHYFSERSNELSANDNGFFYKGFILEQKR